MPHQILLCPIQFSIGVIVFEHAFWETIGHLPVYRRRLLAGLSTLGADEEHICAKAVTSSRPIVSRLVARRPFLLWSQYAP